MNFKILSLIARWIIGNISVFIFLYTGTGTGTGTGTYIDAHPYSFKLCSKNYARNNTLKLIDSYKFLLNRIKKKNKVNNK